MKKLCFTSGLVFSCFLLFGQPVPEKINFQDDLAKVIGDYPNQFNNFPEELLVENP